MSHVSVKPDAQTATETLALTNLTALAISSTGQFIRKIGTTTFENATPGDVSATWGSIGGTLSNQTDLQAALDAKGSGDGTVTTVSVATANGVSGSVATATTTPAITLTLGAITPTTVNGLTITTTTGSLTMTNGKTLSVIKTMSFNAADDTGVYTLPTGTKTLLATDGAGTSLTGIPYTLTGTANQVILSAGTGNITFTLPQSIATGSTVQFAAIELSHATENTLTASSGVLSIEGIVIPTISSTNTLTNKRITPRVVTAASDTTAVIDCDVTDDYYLTAMAGATEISVTGTPTTGQEIFIGLKDDGTGRALTWTGITALGVTLPTTTVANKQHIIKIKYISAAWWGVAVGAQA